MKKSLWIIIGAVLVAGSAGALYLGIQHLKTRPSSDVVLTPRALSQEELIAFTKPAVVRIVQSSKGTIFIPQFTLDPATFQITLIPGAAPVELPVDEYYLGSGFVVHEDGYVVTNAHVVSREALRQEIQMGFEEGVAFYPELDHLADEQFYDTVESIAEQVIQASRFELDKKIVVLNPGSSGETLEDLMKQGFPAKMISVNDDFSKDERDVALIKIEATNLPTLPFSSRGAAVGQRISVFGFPVSAEFHDNNLLVPTYTQGVISAEKSSKDNAFKILQTDAKISLGSSGGPAFNEYGEVIGLITFQTGEYNQGSGDNFAFAIPVGILERTIETTRVPSAELPAPLAMGEYSTHLHSGLNYLENARGARALAAFQQSAGMGTAFGSTSYVAPYLEKASALIASGNSVDTQWDEKKGKWTGISLFHWSLIGGALLLVALIALAVVFFKRMRKDEQVMHHLEEELAHSHPEEPAVTLSVTPPAL